MLVTMCLSIDHLTERHSSTRACYVYVDKLEMARPYGLPWGQSVKGGGSNWKLVAEAFQEAPETLCCTAHLPQMTICLSLHNEGMQGSQTPAAQSAFASLGAPFLSLDCFRENKKQILRY